VGVVATTRERSLKRDHPVTQSDLKGNTLRVYLELLKAQNGHLGVRQIQRSLGFSSPSLAQYHLERLVEMGLVRTEAGEYQISRQVQVDVLKEFIKVGSHIIPRLIVYAVMFSVLTGYFLYHFTTLNFYSMWALIFAVLGTGAFWYETVVAWRRSP
jgi:DNA-binding MarR family transcriptional regulator